MISSEKLNLARKKEEEEVNCLVFLVSFFSSLEQEDWILEQDSGQNYLKLILLSSSLLMRPKSMRKLKISQDM